MVKAYVWRGVWRVFWLGGARVLGLYIILLKRLSSRTPGNIGCRNGYSDEAAADHSPHRILCA